MKNSIRFVMGVLVPAFIWAGVVSSPVVAQDKAKDAKAAPAAEAKKGAPVLKVYLENDHVRVYEVTFKPGDAAANVARAQRVLHAVKGGTLMRIYPDGKRDPLVLKTGEVKVAEASPPYIPKNEGKTDIVLFVVLTKEPKK